MSNIYLVPEWFFGLSIGLEVLFALVSGIVAAYSYRIYLLSYGRNSRLFTIGFSLISLSYILKAFLNLFVLSEVKEGLKALSIDNLNLLGLIGTYAHIILFTTGLVTVAYMTFDIKSWRVYSLMLATNLIVLILSSDEARAFNMLSTLLILYICIHYGVEFKENKRIRTLLLFLSFVLLLFSGVGFIIAENYYLNYVIGHILELGAYVIILISLVLTIKIK